MLLLTFQAAGQRYAVDASRVVEVVPRIRLRPLPHTPAHLAGVFEFRGEVVSAIDMSVLLEGEAAPERLSTRIILVDASPGPKLLALIAEEVDDLTTVDPADLLAPPVRLPTALYLGDLVETEKGVIQLIAVDKILDAEKNDAQTTAAR